MPETHRLYLDQMFGLDIARGLPDQGHDVLRARRQKGQRIKSGKEERLHARKMNGSDKAKSVRYEEKLKNGGETCIH